MNTDILKYMRWVMLGLFILCGYLGTSYDPLIGNKILMVACCFLLSASTFIHVAYSRLTGETRVGRAKIHKEDMPLLFNVVLVAFFTAGLIMAGWGIAIITGHVTLTNIN
ncbi:MAG: hypothetical protein GC137_06205 [Alphaproteobacteria bacterium]|nr:hypothetical protein [Alphaproteobacteria bacterium]